MPKISLPSIFLHLDGAMLLFSSVLVYFHLRGSWLLFIFLLFAPDISMISYYKDAKIGGIMYNIFHSYLGPGILSIIGLFAGDVLLIKLGMIWFAHIGMDRMLGYGLKYPTNFNDTHFKHI